MTERLAWRMQALSLHSIEYDEDDEGLFSECGWMCAVSPEFLCCLWLILLWNLLQKMSCVLSWVCMLDFLLHIVFYLYDSEKVGLHRILSANGFILTLNPQQLEHWILSHLCSFTPNITSKMKVEPICDSQNCSLLYTLLWPVRGFESVYSLQSCSPVSIFPLSSVIVGLYFINKLLLYFILFLLST